MYVDILIILLIPTTLVSALFLQQHPCFFVYFMFFVLKSILEHGLECSDMN